MTLVIGRLPAGIRKVIEFWCATVAAGITIYFSWYIASLTWESYSYHDLSPGMIAVPIWIPQAAMLMGVLILSMALVDELISMLSGKEPSYAGKGEKLLADDEPDSVVQVEKR